MGKKNKVEDGEKLTDEEDSKYGHPSKYDPTFKGPIENRGCTDVICCILFLACFAGLFVVGYLAWTQGNPLTLIKPTDTLGNICGYSDTVTDKPYLYFFNFLDCLSYSTLLNIKCATTQICVSSCPNYTAAPYTSVALSIADNLPLDVSLINWDNFICDYDFDPQAEYLLSGGQYEGSDGLAKMFEDQKCASYVIPQSPYLDRCIPSFLVNSLSTVTEVFSEDEFILTGSGENNNITASNAGQLFETSVNLILDVFNLIEVIYQDVASSWYLILAGMGIGMLLSFIFIIIMRWLAGVIIWFSIFALYAVLGVGIYYSYYMYKSLEGVDGADAALTFTSNLSSYLRLQTTWLVFGIILSVVLAILLLMTLCLCTRIRIAISLIKEASRAIGHMISTLFWPILPFLLELIVVALWACIAVYLATSHQAMYVVYNAPSDYGLANGTSCDVATFASNNTTAHCGFQEYALPYYTIYLQFYNLFMFFWLVNFMIALGQITLAGAFASYYWAFTKPQDIPAFPLFKSFYRSIRYHLGSIAFGSLIIAIIQIIRVLLEYVEQKLKGKADNDVVKYIIKCLKCCFWCLEKIMKFLNKNAYILIAIYGKNFCTSAKNAFFLLMRNIVRVAVVNKLTNFVLFMGELLVVGAVGVASFFYFTNQISFISNLVTVPDLTYYWIPIIVIVVGTYFIAVCFFGVYDMAVDTLFLCFLEDLERHDGSAEKPYYMSKELMNIVGKKNKFGKGKGDDDDD
ncbi:choline transporter-like protein 2 isoform X2 [Lytechinus variegatus]|uniref:choline transporter-like protein 2 isoform X1 n=1 Tax=Lytechinus variegatus TaxID=7654 RepID=UPI001BB2A055|nr:choline transporter-like protein 2 isoform X1 [Lytechinus variegatus]XP_041482145.1 choline transporter-like protein 2 isoform X2 [Lytechinus variegatus]